MPIRSLKADAKLAESNLSLSLNATCQAIVFALGDAVLSSAFVEKELPALVHEVAIDARWIEVPGAPSKDAVELGRRFVGKRYRGQFMDLLKPTYDSLLLRADKDGWLEPTPSQRIKRFKYLTGWSDQKIADEMRKVYQGREFGSREPVSVKTIRRIQATKGLERHNARWHFLTCLAEVMRKARPKEFSVETLSWHHLQWRKKHKEF